MEKISALMLAILKGHTEVADQLISAGASLDLQDEVTKQHVYICVHVYMYEYVYI